MVEARRCPWGESPDDMRRYHDEEWGRPLRGDRAIFERLSLEGFQSGLSWLTILRKREAFRSAFDGFDVELIAAYDESDVRLLADTGVRPPIAMSVPLADARSAFEALESGQFVGKIVLTS
ncbi:MAG: DNA-3-methyladenine glycosylase I [Actinomycetota bacterium]